MQSGMLAYLPDIKKNKLRRVEEFIHEWERNGDDVTSFRADYPFGGNSIKLKSWFFEDRFDFLDANGVPKPADW